MTFAEKKEKLLNALVERNGLQYIVDVASEIVNNPIFIFDLSGKLIVKSHLSEGDNTWNVLFPDGHMVFADMKSVENAGVIEYLVHNDSPIYGSFGFYPNRFLGCRIRDKNEALAIACVVENQPLKEEDEELLIIICKTALFEMLYYERTAMQSIPYFSLLKDVIEKNVGKMELSERIKSTKLKSFSYMRLLAVGYPDSKSRMSSYLKRESIVASVPNCYSILYKEQILVLIDEAFCDETHLSIIRKCMSDSECWIGVSNVFTELSELADAYQQISAIRQIRETLKLETSTTYYEDIMFYHFFEIASKHMDIRLLDNQLLKKIEVYDVIHNTCLLESLEAYLESGRNIQQAAVRMHTHKNTLYYRLQRVKEQWGIDLEDENTCFNLQFSLRMRRMFK